MTNDDKEELSGTPFDDVFKTAAEKMGHLLVTVIEQMFQVKAEIVDIKEIERIANERYLINKSQSKVSKRFTDNCFKIAGGYYHIECQSTEDGSILFRLAEYNMRIALDNAEQLESDYSVRIVLPNSGLINLRSSSDSPKFSEMQIKYCYTDQEIIMPVPVMNIQAYSADDIFDNGLYFLIPFYAIRYESRLIKISDKNDPEYDKIYSELKTYYDRLLEACESGIISENDTRKIAELSRIILEHISRRLNSDLKERMVAILGGQVLELQEDRWLKQGYEEGIEKGKELGTQSLLYSLVMDKVIDASVAAKRAGKDEDQFLKDMEAYIAEQKKDMSKKQL
ncbi:hypothetical protein [Oribacterium sp. WCC10]|uniref:hypothetical protein n=1 Tax=Oribacterium sp. WCC10 TaxID=1855343 RepID=UPI0008E58547|nr:hypothetical protein [Oribacterium sp. WCC10]SFG18742.1 hypothetical protein SAMN05216356_10324 [Oribacterium sp. WCC10]